MRDTSANYVSHEIIKLKDTKKSFV